MITNSKYESYERSASYAELASLRTDNIFSRIKLAQIVCGQQWGELGLFWGRIGCKVKIDSLFFRSLFLDNSNYLNWGFVIRHFMKNLILVGCAIFR